MNMRMHALTKLEFIDWIEEHNEVYADRLQPGQTIVIPIKSESSSKFSVFKVRRVVMKAIIYCRVSTVKETQATSLVRQEDELIAFANKLNIEVVSIIKEQASGYELNRDGIFEILDLFKNKEADTLLIPRRN